MTNQHNFTLRPATFEDLPELVDLFNRAARDMGSAAEFTLEGYNVEWRLAGFTLEDDTRVAVMPDGRIGGLMEYWNSAPHVSSWLWGRVDPALRGHGIGSAMLHWGEARAESSLHRAPEGTLVTVEVASDRNNQAAQALFLERGYKVVRRSLTMQRSLDHDIPEPVLPPNIVIRPMRAGEERAVYAADQEAFRDHWGFVETPFEEGFERSQSHLRDNPHHDPSLWFLAVDGDEIAGIALCSPHIEDFPDGWVDTLAVRRPWRKQGLGLALLCHSFRELRARGLPRVGLSVDAQSLTGATRLYERAGMHVSQESLRFEKVLREGRDLSTQTVEE